MSAVHLGAQRVGRVMTILSRLGYRCARVSASGQRRGARREEDGIPGDILAIAVADGQPHLMVEVGGERKRLAVTFGEMRECSLPGFVPIVVRYVEHRAWWYADEDTRVATASELLEALRS